MPFKPVRSFMFNGFFQDQPVLTDITEFFMQKG